MVVVVLSLTACAPRLQPVVLLYVPDGLAAETKIREIARMQATAHDMYWKEFESRYGEEPYTIFGATNNDWFYRQGLASGARAGFAVVFLDERIRITLVGPPDNRVVHALVADWTATLNSADIEYEKVIRQPLQPVAEH